MPRASATRSNGSKPASRPTDRIAGSGSGPRPGGFPISEAHAQRLDRFARAGLYLVTSQAHSAGRTTADIVAAALDAGVRLIQVREKGWTDRELFRLVVGVREMTAAVDALLIVNDRVDVALAAEADGVHLGRDDLPPDRARRLAPDLIIGVSAHSGREAVAAQRAGASYVNLGPIYPTRTKSGPAECLGLEGLRRARRGLTVPFTVMGGIKSGHLRELVAAGAVAIAVVTAVTAAADPGRAAASLLAEIAAARGRRSRRGGLR